jgi:hypothetical protein
MKKLLITLIISTLLLTACTSASGSTPVGPMGTPNAAMQTQIASGGSPGGFAGPGAQVTATATPTAQPTATPQPTPTVVSQTALAEQAAQAYFDAVQKEDYAGASKLVSAFSQLVFKMTASDVAAALTQQAQQGITWSDLQINSSQVFDDHTILVNVTYQQTVVDAKTGAKTTSPVNATWALRIESNQWLVNWDNVIDFETLDFTTKTTAGLAITPLQLTRYTDRIVMTVLAQNYTNETIVIGQTNQILATFHFGNQAVNAVNTRYVFDRLRSYDNVQITVMGLYTSYPDSVEMVKYINYTVSPWYTFGLDPT